MSLRLSAVMNLVPPCRKLADIGCDHAYVSIELVRNGTAEACVASDVREGPLVHARKNVEAAGLSDKISVRLFPGAQGLKKGECDCLLISGMGGRLMTDMLLSSADIVMSADALVLEPQSDMFLVRRALRELGFAIAEEDFVKDSGKYYQIILALKKDERKNEEKLAHASEVIKRAFSHFNMDCMDDERIIAACDKYGPVLLSRRNKLMHEFLLERKAHFDGILSDDSFVNSPLPKSQERLTFVRKEAADVDTALKFYEQAL